MCSTCSFGGRGETNKNQWAAWFHPCRKRQPFIQSVLKPVSIVGPSVAVIVVELYVKMVHILTSAFQTFKMMI